MSQRSFTSAPSSPRPVSSVVLTPPPVTQKEAASPPPEAEDDIIVLVNTATPTISPSSSGVPEVLPLPALEAPRDSSDGEETGKEGGEQKGGELTGSVAAVVSSPALPQVSCNFMLPTTASINKMRPRSPSPTCSPRKKMPWLLPSPSPSAFQHSSARRHTPVSKLPQPIKKPLLDAAVNSPVAAYVKNNPAPHLVQNVKAKEPETPLDSTMVEVEGKENHARLSLLPQCPLPSAVYKASSVVVAREENNGEERNDYEYVTEAYGAVSRFAKVTKQVSRVQLPKAGLSWNEDLLAFDESCNSSPSMAKFKPPGRPVLKTTRRDSGLFDESMMNVSVVETKVVKKVARGKGGARGTFTRTSSS